MQLLKKMLTNALIVFNLFFGLTISAIASDDINWIKAQAGRGDAAAQTVLASSYSLGRDGLIQDYSKAVYWHKKAADQGNATSQYLLGQLYNQGKGVRQDYNKAIYWHKKSSDQNNASAQYALGAIYYFGQGVRQNKTQAKEWFGKSCDNGMQFGCDTYRELNEEGY